MAKMKKWTAMLMVLSLLLSVMAVPAGAEEDPGSEENANTVTVEITDADGNVIGEMTTTTISTEEETPGSHSETTDVDRNWNTLETEGSVGEPTQDGNTITQTTNTVVTEVTGSEQTEEYSHTDKAAGTQTIGGSGVGYEDTTITDTTTTVTTTTGDLHSDTTAGPETTMDGVVEEGEWSDPIQTGEGQWESDGEPSEGDYQKVDGSEKVTDHGASDVEAGTDPLDEEDVTLEMTPGGRDEQTLYITIEEALAGNISYEEGLQADGSTVTCLRDEAGQVIGYKITRVNQTPGTPGELEEADPAAPEKNGGEIKTYIRPEGYTPGTLTSEDGNVVTTTEEILDESGNVIGYRITEVTTHTGASGVDPSSETTIPAPSHCTLPEKPVAPDPVTDEYGLTTTVTVEDIVENGDVVGYKTITIITDEDGNEIYTESNSIYGTVTSYSSRTDKTPETDVVTTTKTTTVYGTLTTQHYTVTTSASQTTENTRDVSEDIYQLVQTDEGLFFLYQGRMYRVTAIGDHGDITMTSLQPNISGLEPSGSDGTVSSTTLLRNPENFDKDNGIAAGYELEYVGYGLETAIRVNKNYQTDAGEVLAHQFLLTDRQGNKHYVLCADLGTNAVRGADYNMTNVASANYYVRDGAAEKIEAIAISGYWGTKSGIGSLDAVKAFLKANSSLTQAQIDALKPGEALTATQAAIWYYGNSDESKTMASDAITGSVYKNGGGFRSATADEAIRINTLYQALINVDPDKVTNNTTEFLNKDNFATETSLTIKEKAVDEEGNVKTDENGNEKYVTDLTFGMDVKKSDLTGNLTITITDENGNTLHTAQLKTDSSNLVGRILADGSAGSSYTIYDLELAEGVKINLNLSGTQTLQEGVYLYSAAVYSTSQTFVGVASGERDVNLNVQMKFDVTDPEAQVSHTTKTWSEQQVEEENFTRTDHYKQEKPGTETTQTVTTNTKTYGLTVQTDVTTQVTEQNRDWNYAYEYTLMLLKDEDGGGDDGGDGQDDGDDKDGGGGQADAPKTGDVTLVMAAVSLLSAGGMLFLHRRKEEEE